jgi:hypothetical protein
MNLILEKRGFRSDRLQALGYQIDLWNESNACRTKSGQTIEMLENVQTTGNLRPSKSVIFIGFQIFVVQRLKYIRCSTT